MFRHFNLVLLLSGILLLAFQIHRSAHQRSVLRADEMELSHITYGLFDPSEWKDVISGIMEKKVLEFELTGANRDQVRRRAMDLMNGLLTEVEHVMNERNKAKGVGGAVKNAVMGLLVNIDDLRSGIPRYADMIVEYANDPKNREEMKCFVVDKLNEVGCSTDGKVDRTLLKRTLARYDTSDRSTALAKIRADMSDLDAHLRKCYLLLGIGCCTLLLLAVMAGAGEKGPLAALISAGLCLLVLGVHLPMIDIEARIERFELTLLGEPVDFVDQVLFHQSKSILQVVEVLLKERKPELMFVAAAVFAFSVVLPSLKMSLSVITLWRGREPKGRIASWLLHRAGKWSMADVMVVAIFMAFIGFNGVVDSQLTTLEGYATSVHVLTTNNSALQVGFYLFTAYCSIGLISSALLPRALAPSS
ncbi:MAG: paraquat-inducible protein A [Flavobacteriales bacterium]|nr:paraquat-inducible protein A [Flavobacteriales bacterium]